MIQSPKCGLKPISYFWLPLTLVYRSAAESRAPHPQNNYTYLTQKLEKLKEGGGGAGLGTEQAAASQTGGEPAVSDNACEQWHSYPLHFCTPHLPGGPLLFLTLTENLKENESWDTKVSRSKLKTPYKVIQ